MLFLKKFNLFDYNFFFNFNILNWRIIFLNFGLNYYSNGLIITIILIFGIIVMNLNFINLKNYCLLINLLLIFIIYVILFPINLILFYFIFESSSLSIFCIIIKWGYGEFRFNSSFYLIFYTLISSFTFIIFII